MKIYITRHGQVDLNAEYYNGDVSLPKGEFPLSALGRQQAVLLGKKLKALGFKGTILSSPLLRTMETAELIAGETGSQIVPTPWFHEIFGNQNELDAYRGSGVDTLQRLFPHVTADAFLEERWWPVQAETMEAVKKRVSLGLKACMENGAEDILLVGHAASVCAALNILKLRESGILWNCGLSLYDTEQPENSYFNETVHLPGELVTCNKVMGADIGFDASYVDLYPLVIPDQLRKETGLKLLHIGDTHSETYLYYRQLVQMVKPDMIVHTGDSVDEVKVGRVPEAKAEYLTKLPEILEILKGANCKVYWVPGNNDLPGEIAKRAPFLEILQPNTVLRIADTDICVTHSREQITQKADIYLYGHGRRADNAEEEMYPEGSGALYLNTVWNNRVLVLPSKETYAFERPEYRKGIWKHE